MPSHPQDIARYTVEQNGGSYRTTPSDLLRLFGWQELTPSAGQQVQRALLGVGVGVRPDLSAVRPFDRIELYLVETVLASSRWSTPPQRPRFAPRTWKGWLGYAVIALVLIALIGESFETPSTSGSGPAPNTEQSAAPSAPDTNDADEEARRDRAREARARKLGRQRAAAARKRRQRQRELADARREEQRRLEEQRQVEQQRRLEEKQRQEEAASSCHPSYDPCLDPNASDYDCEGGSGDGPEYTGLVTVKGPDEYDLDSDADGTGCDS